MTIRGVAARFALVAFCAFSTVTPAQARFWQCVPYARMISGIDIRGNALTWWNQAAGKYLRGNTPKKGAVMAFAPTSRMRLGHVATVSQVVNDREVILNHANWSRRGGVETSARAVDVSANGDWSQVKVWFSSNGDLGTSTYPVRGFIYSTAAKATDSVLPVVQSIASAAAAKFTLASLAPQVGSN